MPLRRILCSLVLQLELAKRPRELVSNTVVILLVLAYLNYCCIGVGRRTEVIPCGMPYLAPILCPTLWDIPRALWDNV